MEIGGLEYLNEAKIFLAQNVWDEVKREKRTKLCGSFWGVDWRVKY